MQRYFFRRRQNPRASSHFLGPLLSIRLVSTQLSSPSCPESNPHIGRLCRSLACHSCPARPVAQVSLEGLEGWKSLFTAFSLFDADAGTTAAVRGKRMTQLAANGAGRKCCVIFTQTPGTVPLNTPPILHHSRLRPDLAHPPEPQSRTSENIAKLRFKSFYP